MVKHCVEVQTNCHGAKVVQPSVYLLRKMANYAHLLHHELHRFDCVLSCLSVPTSSLKRVNQSLKKKCVVRLDRSEEHTSELQSLIRISYAVFCLKKKNT